MQGIAERNLLAVHENTVKHNLVPRILKVFIGILLLCIIPYLHIGVFSAFVWPGKPPIDKRSCTCSCFDTIFRGYYEHPPSNYKHWYFNATGTAYKIWCLIIVGVILSYECFKFLLSLVLEKDYRKSMLLVFLLSIFPHYYGWWNYLNYYNEQFYDQWYHQLYFTVTELISTGFVLHLCRKSTKLQTYHIIAILSINLSHIIIGGLDQFIENIVYKLGSLAQVVRDLGLVLPDIVSVFAVIYEAMCLARVRNIQLSSLFYKEEIGFAVVITTFMVFIGKNIYW